MIISAYFIYLGLLLFSFSLDKHYRVVISQNVNTSIKTAARVLAGITLVVGLSILIKIKGISLGITYWVGILVLANFIIAFTYTYKPKIILALSVTLFVLSLIVTIL